MEFENQAAHLDSLLRNYNEIKKGPIHRDNQFNFEGETKYLFRNQLELSVKCLLAENQEMYKEMMEDTIFSLLELINHQKEEFKCFHHQVAWVYVILIISYLS
jgi:hypothetical protein